MITSKVKLTPARSEWMKKKAESTEVRRSHIIGKGYTFVEIYECQYNAVNKLQDVIDDIPDMFLPRTARQHTTLKPKELLAAVDVGSFFGMVEVDICVSIINPNCLEAHQRQCIVIFHGLSILTHLFMITGSKCVEEWTSPCWLWDDSVGVLL